MGALTSIAPLTCGNDVSMMAVLSSSDAVGGVDVVHQWATDSLRVKRFLRSACRRGPRATDEGCLPCSYASGHPPARAGG